MHFPARFGGGESEALLYYQQRQRRLQAQCAWLTTQNPAHLAKAAEVEAWLLEQATPQIFDDGAPENVLTEHRRRAGRLYAGLTAAGYAQPQQMTLFDLHSAIDFLNEKHKRS